MVYAPGSGKKTLLDEVLESVSSTTPIDEALCPEEPLRKGDEEVGVLVDEKLRRLFCLVASMTNTFKELAGRKPQSQRGSEVMALLEETEFASNRLNRVAELFWTSVRDQFNLNGGTVGIRAEWKIVRPQDGEKGCDCLWCRLAENLDVAIRSIEITRRFMGRG